MGYVRSGMVVGLGTGSTADQFLQALAAALREGRVTGITGVPTSRQSERRAMHLGIPLTTLSASARPAITIDGADEVDPSLDLIKGLGGALLREKIVAQNSDQLLIIADSSKAVTQLGTQSPLPVEVAMFAHETHEDYLRDLGAEPALRRTQEGTPFTTDNGNYIYDCRFRGGIADPAALSAALRARAGIVESGLFLGIAAIAINADENKVEVREKGK